MSNFLWSFAAFVIVIGISVIVHELGHYLTARLLGVQVHEFAFGMGSPLIQIRQKNKTRMLWSWRLLPIGGFCRLAGMGEESEDETVLPGMGFNEQPAWKRFFILLNGSVGNVLLALLLTVAFLCGYGAYNMYDTKIGALMEGFPAQQAGFQVGDRILEVNGKAVSEWREMSDKLRAAAREGDVTFTVERDGQTLKITTAVPFNAESGNPMLGVTAPFVRYSIPEALTNAVRYLIDMTRTMLAGIWDWITLKQEADVTGPVGIASMSGQAMRDGVWSFFYFLVLINLNLGLLNLFPFPALDGGRIVFVVLEMIFWRRMPEKVENWIHTVGLVLLLTLIAFVTYKDICNIFFAN